MIYAETERLILRSWRRDDLPLFAEINRNQEVMKYFRHRLAMKRARPFTIVFKKNSRIRGGAYMPWN